MTADEAQDKVKYRLDIPTSNTDLDTEIDEFVSDAVDRLYPVISEPYAVSFSYVATTHGTRIALSTIDSDLVDIDKIRTKGTAQDDSEYLNIPSSEWEVQGGYLFIRGYDNQNATWQVHGRKRHVITTVPAEFNLVVVNWALSEFYEMLVGSKRKFNVYQQASGIRSVDGFTDKAESLERKGNDILADRADLGGV